MEKTHEEDFYPRKCSRWIACSVNCCPLDPLNERRYMVSDDPERTCKEDPKLRVEIAIEAKDRGINIPGGGLTHLERASGKTLEELAHGWNLKQTNKNEKLRKARDSRNLPPTPPTEMVQGYPNHNPPIGAN
jgi:hypothetical protein